MNAVVSQVTTPSSLSMTTTKNFPGLLKARASKIAKTLPKHLPPDRMLRAALTAYRQKPKLAECDPESVFAAAIQGLLLGLEFGIMGEAHLVPFRRECQLIPGYQGLMKLARNTGKITHFYAYEVRAKDEFNVVLGLNRWLTHEPVKEYGFPASEEARGPIVGFYAVAEFEDGSREFEPMSLAQVIAIRDRSPNFIAAKRYGKESPWDTDFIPMGLKTAIRRLCKWLPRSPELVTALMLDTLAEQGKSQQLTVEGVLSGGYALVDEDDTDRNGLNPDAGEGEPIPLKPESQALIEHIQGAASFKELQGLSARVAAVEGPDRTAVTEAWKGKELGLSAAADAEKSQTTTAKK